MCVCVCGGQRVAIETHKRSRPPRRYIYRYIKYIYVEGIYNNATARAIDVPKAMCVPGAYIIFAPYIHI